MQALHHHCQKLKLKLCTVQLLYHHDRKNAPHHTDTLSSDLNVVALHSV